MEYKPCGNICLPTCSDLDGTGCGDMEGCEEGCFCKEGMVFDGVGKCFAKEKCGCEVPDQNGVYVNVSEKSGFSPDAALDNCLDCLIFSSYFSTFYPRRKESITFF